MPLSPHTLPSGFITSYPANALITSYPTNASSYTLPPFEFVSFHYSISLYKELSVSMSLNKFHSFLPPFFYYHCVAVFPFHGKASISMPTFAFPPTGMVKPETRVSAFISCALLLGNLTHLLISRMFYAPYLYL